MIVLPFLSAGTISSSFGDKNPFIDPPFPATIRLSGGWVSHDGTPIDGIYVKVPGSNNSYYCPDIIVLDGYQGNHPLLYNTLDEGFQGLVGPEGDGWYIIADDFSHYNFRYGNNDKIPRTYWDTLVYGSSFVGTYIGR